MIDTYRFIRLVRREDIYDFYTLAYRPESMWSLGDRPSLRFVRDIFNSMRNKDVELEFTSDSVYESFVGPALRAGKEPITDGVEYIKLNCFPTASLLYIDPSVFKCSTLISVLFFCMSYSSGAVQGDEIDLTAVGTSGSSSVSGTIADELTSRYAEARKLKKDLQQTDVQKRIEKRKEYMEVVEQRNDSTVLGWAVGLFLGPAVVILAVAYLSGYLDTMYSNSLSAFK